MKITKLTVKCSNCKKVKATSLIRAQAVCAKCFDILNRDNYMRIRAGSSIPRDLVVMFP